MHENRYPLPEDQASCGDERSDFDPDFDPDLDEEAKEYSSGVADTPLAVRLNADLEGRPAPLVFESLLR